MGLVIATYWPFALGAFGAGVVVGWWFQSPGSVDHVTAWLQRDIDPR